MQELAALPVSRSVEHGGAEVSGKTAAGTSNMSISSDDSSQLSSSALTSCRRSEHGVMERQESRVSVENEPSIESPEFQPSCQTTIITLTSISASSSAFPESFGLSASPKGRWIVAYSSGALYIIPTARLTAPENHCRAFRLRRKPMTVVINDIGHFAILSSVYKVDVYRCGDGTIPSLSSPVVNVQSIQLHSGARTIALSTNGQLIAAGSEIGVEIVSLGLPEGYNRRQIQSGSVETMTFSEDQKSLLITGSARSTRNSTILSIAINFEQAMMEDEADDDQAIPVEQLWISQLIFPEHLLARQSVFLPDPSNGQVSELLAYDRAMDRFGIFDTVLKQFNGKALSVPDNVIWRNGGRYEDTGPGVTCNGSRVAVAVRLDDSSEVWIYQTPTEWRDEDGPMVDNAPVERVKLTIQANGASEAIHALKWIEHPGSTITKLLALINTFATSVPEDMEATSSTAASGKMILLDFVPTSSTSQTGPHAVSLDLDAYHLNEVIAEEQVELDHEIDLVRRRTQIQRSQHPQRSRAPHAIREASLTSAPRLRRAVSTSSGHGQTGVSQDIFLHSSQLPRRRSFSSVSDAGEDNEVGATMRIEEPYSQTAPRSQFMLNRAATVAQHAPVIRTPALGQTDRSYDDRRADGLREIPHESDADNWVPPPPPYTASPDRPGPNAISLPIQTIPGLAERVLQGSHVQQNQAPSPHGMRSRVSRVLSGVQIPVLQPPIQHAQLRYADPSTVPGPPANVSLRSSAPSRLTMPPSPAASQASRSHPTQMTRSPTLVNFAPSSNAMEPSSASAISPSLVSNLQARVVEPQMRRGAHRRPAASALPSNQHSNAGLSRHCVVDSPVVSSQHASRAHMSTSHSNRYSTQMPLDVSTREDHRRHGRNSNRTMTSTMQVVPVTRDTTASEQHVKKEKCIVM